MRSRTFIALALLGAACNGNDAGAGQWPSPSARLVLADLVAPGAPEHALDKAEIARGAVETVAGFDPYYQRAKRFRAVPLAPLLRAAFPGVELETAELVLRADDGYAVPIEGARLLDGTAYLALGDADHAGRWDPIGPQGVDPGGFYVVWKGPERTDLVRYPRPWALARIERTRFEAVYPHTSPGPAAAGGSAAQRGYAIFRSDCIRCHAINREGGRVGPDLNVPQSIVEYRPVAQIRAYIRDPQTFRYSAMPAHPHLGETDLDALIAYFSAMKAQKHDPEAPR